MQSRAVVCASAVWKQGDEKRPLFSQNSGRFVKNIRTFHAGSLLRRRRTSALDVQPIVGVGHAFGELCIGLALSAGLVAHVDEIGA